VRSPRSAYDHDSAQLIARRIIAIHFGTVAAANYWR
jgi:hypothetical protein